VDNPRCTDFFVELCGSDHNQATGTNIAKKCRFVGFLTMLTWNRLNIDLCCVIEQQEKVTNMPITSVSSSALQGIQRGFQGMRRSALEIANHGQGSPQFPTKDLVRAMVELHQHKQSTVSSLAAFKTADEMVGALLDLKV